MTNQRLAAAARDIARQADPLTRRAALSLAVLLDASRTIDGARRMLAELDGIAPQLRPAAGRILDMLTASPEERP